MKGVKITQALVITREQIDAIFDEATEQADYILGLYRLVYSDFDKREKVEPPLATYACRQYICQKAIEWDEEHNISSMLGGAYLNYGFDSGTHDDVRNGFLIIPQ